jgi:putative transposase
MMTFPTDGKPSKSVLCGRFRKLSGAPRCGSPTANGAYGNAVFGSIASVAMRTAAHVDYCHINPLKHGHVKQVSDWPYSTFHRYVEAGLYPRDQAGGMEPDIATGEGP